MPYFTSYCNLLILITSSVPNFVLKPATLYVLPSIVKSVWVALQVVVSKISDLLNVSELGCPGNVIASMSKSALKII